MQEDIRETVENVRRYGSDGRIASVMLERCLISFLFLTSLVAFAGGLNLRSLITIVCAHVSLRILGISPEGWHNMRALARERRTIPIPRVMSCS